MEPAIKTGSAVIVKSASSYMIGDIITFYDNENKKNFVTHRLVEKINSGNTTQLITKGDANNTNDSTNISNDLIVGRVILSVPYLGYLIELIKTTTGFVIIIVIPATIIIYEELKKIHQEARKIITKRRLHKKND